MSQKWPEADINRNSEIAADWPLGIGSHRKISAVHHVVGQQLGTRLRGIHDPLADKVA